MAETLSQVSPIVEAGLDLGPPVAHAQICEQDAHLSHVLLEPDIDVHDPIRESLDVALKAKVQEEHIFDFVVVLVFIEMILGQKATEVCHSFHLSQSVMVVEIVHDVVDSLVTITADMAASFVDEHRHVV